MEEKRLTYIGFLSFGLLLSKITLSSKEISHFRRYSPLGKFTLTRSKLISQNVFPKVEETSMKFMLALS